MAALSFELSTIPGTISANVNFYELATPGGDYAEVIGGANPEHIHDDQDWEVRLENLTQNGAIFGAFGGNQWRFRIYFEQLGAGEGPGYKEVVFAVNTNVPFTYPTQKITVPAGYLAEGNYELVAELKMIDANGLAPISGAGKLAPGGTPGTGKILQIINA